MVAGIGDICENFRWDVLFKLDVNNDGFEDEIVQEFCNEKPDVIMVHITDPRKPDRWVGFGREYESGESFLQRGTHEYKYRGFDYDVDPIRVRAFNNEGLNTLGLHDKVSYARECGWTDIPQIASQVMTSGSEQICADTGVIDEFVFVIDEVAGNVVRSGVHLEGSGKFIPFVQLNLLQSANELLPSSRAREIADKLSKVIAAEMDREVERYAEILKQGPRESLGNQDQAELEHIETRVAVRFSYLIHTLEYASDNSETLRSAFKLVTEQLGFAQY